MTKEGAHFAWFAIMFSTSIIQCCLSLTQSVVTQRKTNLTRHLVQLFESVARVRECIRQLLGDGRVVVRELVGEDEGF